MKRDEQLQKIDENEQWDIIVIGGGSTGLGTALDAASRGYKTILFEQHDFAKGTSSRSTKLLHGGVRYLAQGNFKLVYEALHERGLIIKNAQHVTRDLCFIVPSYRWYEKLFYGLGLKFYDLMAGRKALGSTKFLSKKKLLRYLPTARESGLNGGALYHDGQFDDSRLAINLAQTAIDNGAVVLNYMKVTDFIKENKKITGVVVTDILHEKEYKLKAKVVINATGVFTDNLLQKDDHHQHHIIAPSQGVHIVIDKKFFPGEYALMIPKTDDKRILFAVPWHTKVVVGTTDTPVEKPDLEPQAFDREVNFIIEHFNRYHETTITREDVKSVYVGLRPLVKEAEGKSKNTANISREHTILFSESGLVSITGGKWTTYRQMAEDVVDHALLASKLPKKKCVTEDLKIHGYIKDHDPQEPLHVYGSDLKKINEMIKNDPALGEKIHPDFPNSKAEITWTVQNEMAMTVEDILARRIRMLFLDAKAAVAVAPMVADMMAKEMGKDENWKKEQLKNFNAVADHYILK